MKRSRGMISEYNFSFVTEASPDYAAGDTLAAYVTIADAVRTGVVSGVIEGAVLSNKALAGVDIDLIVFDSLPTTALTVNGAYTPSDADLLKMIGAIQFTRHIDFAAKSISLPDINFSGLPFETIPNSEGVENTSLYLLGVVREAANLGDTDDISGKLFIRHD